MRWTPPKDGDIRVRTRFLIFPLTLNGETRWLERVTIKEIFQRSYDGSWWYPVAWVDEETK